MVGDSGAGLFECTKEQFALAMLLKLKKISMDDIKACMRQFKQRQGQQRHPRRHGRASREGGARRQEEGKNSRSSSSSSSSSCGTPRRARYINSKKINIEKTNLES